MHDAAWCTHYYYVMLSCVCKGAIVVYSIHLLFLSTKYMMMFNTLACFVGCCTRLCITLLCITRLCITSSHCSREM